MASRMMRWRPWPPIAWRKFAVKLILKKVEGLSENKEEIRLLAAEIRWKGPKLGFLRRSMKLKRNCTKEEEIRNGFVEWNEEFESFCSLGFYKESGFLAWDVEIRVFNGPRQGSKNKASIIGAATLNLAEFVSTNEENSELNLPLILPGVNTESHPSLYLALSLVELKTAQESSEPIQSSIVPTTSSPSSIDAPPEKDELSALKAGLRKVKILTEFVSTRKTKNIYKEDEGSSKSEDIDYPYPFDTDSLDDDFDVGDEGSIKEESNIRKSFSYGTLATANNVGGSIYADIIKNGEFEDWVYYSHRRSDVGCSHNDVMTSSLNEEVVFERSKRSILPWKRRKLSFRSPKAKGEPLLKKGNGEEGGDDIDHDRRLLSSSDESLSIGSHKTDDTVTNSSALSDFGDDNFAIGSWESKEIISRDNQMKLSAQVFFASIDQRSERAAGESACTALVAVIADWFQFNPETMPIKSQFDSLIREGSLEWRKLCNNEIYMEKFPDKHFDLETILQAKIRPLLVLPEKSFIGFFHPKGLDDDNNRKTGFDFLHGAMSFDNMWDEISRSPPQIYVVSWNDHFFVLKVEHDAYYIVDTLGERLYEGCDQAYILKFDRSTSIHKIEQGEEEEVCKGKESCKEYIKSFLAAIPIRELEDDIKKGLYSSTPLHHRLQIEFNCTESLNEIELVVSQSEEFFAPKEEQRIEVSVPILTNEEINNEFFLWKEEPLVTKFNLTPPLEVV